MRIGVFAMTLFVVGFSLGAEQTSEFSAQRRTASDWANMTVNEKRLYIEGFAAGQMSLIVDLRPSGDEMIDRAHGLSILNTPIDHIVSHLDEIYEVPGFRSVPVGVAVQLAHHYVWQVRNGFRQPLNIQEESRIRGR